jgi:hypothetical protein
MQQWDEDAAAPAPLPRGTANFIREWSTLGDRLGSLLPLPAHAAGE